MPPKKNQEKKVDAAPQSKQTATAADKPNGTAAESTTATAAASGNASKPDQDAYKAEQDSIRAEIDTLQLKLTAVKDKIGLTSKDGPAADRRAALRAELDGLRSSQGNNKASRSRLLDEIKAIQESVNKRIKDIQAAKQKAPFKTVADVDTAIKNLDRQVESGSLTIAQEKRAIADISTFKRARKTVEGFQAEEETIQKERARADELRKELDDPEAKALSDRYETIKKELDQIKKDGDDAYAERNQLFDERNALQKQISELHDRRRVAVQTYRDSHDRYWKKVNEDRERRAEKYRTQRAAEEEEKRKSIIEEIREEARAPAYQSQVEDCQTLIDFFGKLQFGGAVAAQAVAEVTQLFARPEVSGVPKLELRQVEADETLVARKKKGDDEEAYFVGGKGKAKKGAKQPQQQQQPKESEKNGQLNIPLGTLTALLSLSIPPPASHSEIERAIEDLKTKKAWYQANQARETQINIEKGEARIAQLEAKGLAKWGPTGENGHAAEGEAESVIETPAPEETGAVETTA
ncbi:hypothetical protein BKA62DRAFT_754805 [Auriculariales sp. MPI-PUGE-AT-0066]|nr:hypothetical protein BKA62DRAFT_754805 [Auriculariales sp. MPI-PUGE-AT-0066]